MVKALSRKNSDNKGLFLELTPVDWGPKPFRMFQAWLDNRTLHEKLSKILEEQNGGTNM